MGPWGPPVVLPCPVGGGSPQPSMDLPGEVDAAAMVAGGTGRVVVPGGAGIWGPFGVDLVAGPGVRRGSGLERLVGGAAILCTGVVRATGGCGPGG